MKTPFPFTTAAIAVILSTGVTLARAGELGAEGLGREDAARLTVPTVLPTDVDHHPVFGRDSPRTPQPRVRDADRPAASQPVERFGRA